MVGKILPREYVGYSVILNRELSNKFQSFSIGSRFCVMQVWWGKLRLKVYAGCGPREELRWIDPAYVTIWKPSVGQRFFYTPHDGEELVITAVETRGPGWHTAVFKKSQSEFTVHDQELNKEA